MQIPTPSAATETIIGGGLVTSPFWGPILHDVSALAYAITGVCGAVIAVHGVCRIIASLFRGGEDRDKGPQ